MATPQTRTRPDSLAPSTDIGEPSRLDAHNIATDEQAAAHHQCGMQHLATGRVCHLPERHPGGCRFE